MKKFKKQPNVQKNSGRLFLLKLEYSRVLENNIYFESNEVNNMQNFKQSTDIISDIPANYHIATTAELNLINNKYKDTIVKMITNKSPP